MKKHSLILAAGFVALVFLSANGLAQEPENKKLAQTGLQFLSVVSDARAAALASTMTSLETNSSALFFNPATMGFTANTLDVTFSLNQWIADINHNTASLSLRPGSGQYGVFGVALQSVDYGEVLGTVVSDNEQGYLDTGNIDATAFAIGLGYAKSLSDRFSVGGQVKWVRQDLGKSTIPSGEGTTTTDNEVTVLAFDFGTLYKTGFKSLAFGFSARNFSEEIEFAQESFQLPLTFSLAVAMNLLDFTGLDRKEQAALFTFQATNARSHPEQVSFGMEYTLKELLSLRIGYVTANDEDDVSFGLGLSKFGFQVDYAYTPFGLFDEVQRVTLRFSK